MKNAFSILAAFALVVTSFVPTTASAQSDSHTVTVTVAPISVLTVGPDVVLIVDAAAAGANPTPVQGTSSYSLTTNSAVNMKVTAQTNNPMPAGLSLTANLAAPAVGASLGAVALGTTAQDLVTNIQQVAGNNLLMTYEAMATVAAATGSPAFLVTYTLTTQ